MIQSEKYLFTCYRYIELNPVRVGTVPLPKEYQSISYHANAWGGINERDDYNHDTDDGLHITSMAGTWMSVVEGFGGVRVQNGKLVMNPALPKQWQSYSFKITFRGAWFKVNVKTNEIVISNESNVGLEVSLYGNPQTVAANSTVTVAR